MREQWIEVLAQECERTSGNQVSKKIGLSAALISQVLNGKYPGDLNRVKNIVEGALMQYKVHCPVLGEITKDKCVFHQSREMAATNPQRLMLYRACRSGCPNSQLSEHVGHQKSIPVKQLEKPIAGKFDADTRIEQLKRMAKDSKQFQQMLIAEFKNLANKYNKLAK